LRLEYGRGHSMGNNDGVTLQKPLSKFAPKNRGNVNLKKAIMLRAKGMTKTQIAEHFNVTPAAIHQQLSKVEAMLASTADLQAYRDNQAEFMDSIGIRYGERLLQEDAIKGASALQAASVLGIVTDKARLIRGQNTGTVLVIHENAVRAAAKVWDAEPAQIVDE
jgi:hypothetical protein